jgi:dCMP deaminase
MKKKWIDAYMDTARRFAQLSVARRLKVGSIIVKEHRVISIGYNGTPAGWDNECEDESVELYSGYEGNIHRMVLTTKPEVIHAEANAISKLARDGESGKGATLFCTHAPCIHCAKLIYGAGITEVYYDQFSKDELGIEFLQKAGLQVTKILND